MCANNVVRALLSVGGYVTIGQVVAGQTLVGYDAGAADNRQREKWESAHVHLVGRQARRRTDGIVVSELDMRKMQVPIVLSLVDDHGHHFGRSVGFTRSTPPLQLG